MPNGRAIDAGVHVGGGKYPLRLWLVDVQTPKAECCYLTNHLPRVDLRHVPDLYRVRWEVELSIKLDKSVHRLDKIAAERPFSLETCLQASLMASTIVAVLTHMTILPPVRNQPERRGRRCRRAQGSSPCN